MGGGILPVAIHNNKIYFLFGKENKYNDTPGWADFGGGHETNETPIQTAIREGTEELTGFLRSPKELSDILGKKGEKTYPIVVDTYHTFICKMDYNPYLTLYYNNNQKFLQKNLDPEIIKKLTIFEKEEISWFSFEDMKRKKKMFRSFYQQTVDKIIQERKQIELWLQKTKNKTKTRKQKHVNSNKTRKL